MSITVGVYIGKKDRLLRYWYDMLPKGQFSILVKYCIQSYLRGKYFPLDSITDPTAFMEQLQKQIKLAPTQRNVTFSSEDGSLYQWVMELENGYRSEEIKNILKETVQQTLMSVPQTSLPTNGMRQATTDPVRDFSGVRTHEVSQWKDSFAGREETAATTGQGNTREIEHQQILNQLG
ncbi:hypothetical protein [Mechercharimyces sp. CAU 1602]|uniref:hypothetical protein n=1 Tax=Mechercharimyces sp. CAU 1602 TaxID=2973933 RepID=UPI002162042B|nr:hypothetical protein [Mechercharimyces sp. CAU 1602]MCS1352656.1 hypothetical protein [Mechercharimyces sp. CAU 1602]